MSEVELNDGGRSSGLILGIDPGTTGTKGALLRAYEVYDGDKVYFTTDYNDRTHMLVNFPGYHQASVSTLPTSLIYHDTGQLLQWGHEAIKHQARHEFDPKFLVTNWKLKILEDSRQDSWGKPPESYATDFFSVFTNYLFNEPRSCLLNNFGGSEGMKQFKFIDVVIAMPPGWSHQEHSVFSDAAKKALHKFPKVRVITASETECALRSWMQQEGKHLNIGDGEVVILLDLGGGTACLSGFFYEEITGRWVHLESYSLGAGSEVVTANFERDFLRRLKQMGLTGSTRVLYNARQAFDLRKMDVGADGEEEYWNCPVAGLKQEEGTPFPDGFMQFTSEQLRNYFQPLQEEILKKFEELIIRISQTHRKPKYCVLVGAYARNLLFLKSLDIANERYKMQIFSPVNQSEAVAKGACLTRVEGDCRLASGSRISVGILTFMKWSEVMKKYPEAHHFRERRTLWCRVITWIIKKGDEADPDKAIIDHDGTTLRKRYYESKESFTFNETILTSEAHPGDDRYTVLIYGTDDSGWQRNKQDFNEKHKMPLSVREFTLNLTDKPITKKDGSKVALKDAILKRDSDGKYIGYKYYLNLSQTDCRLSLEVFCANGKTRRMLLQYSISAFEVESTELQDEQHFAEQLSQTVRTYKPFVDGNVAGHSVVGTRRSLADRDSRCLPPTPYSRSLRKNRGESQSVDDPAVGPTSGENLCDQSRPNSIRSPSLLRNAGAITEKGNEALQEDSLHAETSVSDLESGMVYTAKTALRHFTGITQQQRDRCASEGQETPTLRRVTRADLTRNKTGRLSEVTPSSNQRTPRRTLPVVGDLGEESDTSEYQPPKKLAKTHHTPSLKDPVTKSKSQGEKGKLSIGRSRR